MNKKIIVIQIIVVILIIVVIAYNLINREEEVFNYEEIVQDFNTVEDQNKAKEEKVEKMKIHVTGEVNNPGVIELEVGARISDAIELAGGITSFANLQNVNLAYELEDGQKLYIPNIDEKNEIYIEEGINEKIVETTNFSSSGKTININKATETELQEIPGIGPAMAQKIVDYREENGKFKTKEDLKNVSGIGEKKFENIKEYIEIK